MHPTSPKFWLIIILMFGFISRMYQLSHPPIYVFDEVYHALTAKLISRNDPRAYEWWHSPVEPNTAIDWLHPPFAKYTQALSIKIFGENSFGWRFSSVVFGVGVIGLVYILSKIAFRDEKLALLAALLTSLDGLLLVQSRVAMNDIHVTFFIVLTLVFYLKYREKWSAKYLLLTGVFGGIAMGTKWSGIFAVGLVAMIEGLRMLSLIIKKKHPALTILRQIGLLIISTVFVPIFMYVLSYSHMFLQGKGLDHFYKLHQQIWWYQTNLEATHGYQSRPWEWFLNLRPVWFHVEYINEDTFANIYTFGNPLLFWTADIAILGTLYWLISHRISEKFKKTDANLVILLLACLIVWVPWSLSPRIMFFYHYTPAVPLMSIILAYWLNRLWNAKIKQEFQWHKVLVGSVVTLIALIFFVWYPNWTALPVSKEFANKVYFIVKSWK